MTRRQITLEELDVLLVGIFDRADRATEQAPWRLEGLTASESKSLFIRLRLHVARIKASPKLPDHLRMLVAGVKFREVVRGTVGGSWAGVDLSNAALAAEHGIEGFRTRTAGLAGKIEAHLAQAEPAWEDMAVKLMHQQDTKGDQVARITQALEAGVKLTHQ